MVLETGGRLAANYRYIVLWASMLALLIGSNSIFLVAVVLKPIAGEFGWPRFIPSLAFSLQFLLAGIGAILMGHWFDRIGIGPPVLLGAVMMSIAAFIVAGMDSYWEFLFAYGLLFGFLGSATLFSPLLANIVNLFDRRRGLAAGIVASGQAFAGTVCPPIAGYVNELVGWRETYFLYGILLVCTLLPLSLIFLFQNKFIDRNNSESKPIVAKAEEAVVDNSLKLGGVSPIIWMVTLCIGIVGCCISMAMPIAHIVSRITDIGYSLSSATEVLAVALLVAGLTRLTLMGYISDRIGALNTLFLFSVVQTITVGLFVAVDGLPFLYLIAVFFGIGYGGILPLYPVVLRDHLSGKGIGRRTAIVIFFGGIGMAAGGSIGGYLHDLTSNYTLAFLIGVVANVVNLGIVGYLIWRLRSLQSAAI